VNREEMACNGPSYLDKPSAWRTHLELNPIGTDKEIAKLKRSIFLAGLILNKARCKSHLDTKEFNKLRADWRELNKDNLTL